MECREIDVLLQEKKSEFRKSININIDEALIREIDESVTIIGKMNNSYCSRNTFFEVAAKNYLEKIKMEVNKLDFIKSCNVTPNNQVIIFTCKDKAQTYQNMFLNNYWSCVSLGKDVVELINQGVIKYFALYRGKPHQMIDSYAEIININKLANGKYEFKLGEVIFLNNPVLLGTAEPSSLMKGRRTELGTLLTVRTIDQL